MSGSGGSGTPSGLIADRGGGTLCTIVQFFFIIIYNCAELLSLFP
ncbi:MAG: hypothetical protein ACJAR2_003284 [Ilumatobacter sp.]|jgi:hypothetical protein